MKEFEDLILIIQFIQYLTQNFNYSNISVQILCTPYGFNYQISLILKIQNQQQMNWSEPRKSYKSSEHLFSTTKKIETTCLNTPILQKDYKSVKQEQSPKSKIRNCPYHFNNQQHVCLTCRKSVCLRCAITYCQSHLVKPEKEIIPILVNDLSEIYIQEKVDQINIKLGQSQQRQEYFEKKIFKLVQKIQCHFDTLIDIITQKKVQIIQYYDQQLQNNISEYRQYDYMLKKKYAWLKDLEQDSKKWEKISIQKIDEITQKVKQIQDQNILKLEKKINKTINGKDKLKVEKLWSEQNLQKILYEVQNIKYKNQYKNSYVNKKRIATESSDNKYKSTVFKSGVKNSGGRVNAKFLSGRKQKGKIDKSQIL